MTCKRLALSPVYVCMIFAAIFGVSTQVSLLLFSSKYLEVTFGVSAAKANYTFGKNSFARGVEFPATMR